MRRRRGAAPPERRLQVLKGGGEASRFSRFKQAAAYYFILVLLALLVAQAGYHRLTSQILARRLQIVTALPGVMETTVETAGRITREEAVIRAPAAGVIVELHPAGERVTAGTALATLLLISRADLQDLLDSGDPGPESFLLRLKTTLRRWFNREGGEDPSDEAIVITGEIPPWFREKVTVRGDRPGLLSHHIDGWEEAVPGSVFNGERFAASLREPAIAVEGLFVEAGQPFIKIINNWQWRFHAVTPLHPGRTLAARQAVTIEFSFAPGNPVEAVLEESRIDPDAGKVHLIYRLEAQLPGFERTRWSGAVLSFERREGIVIPAAALLEREDETGVFINSGGTVIFVPLTVVRRSADRVMVEGIAPYSLVITRPHQVREGQRLN